MVAKGLIMLVIGSALGSPEKSSSAEIVNEAISDGISVEDECHISGDCAMNALQRAALKMETAGEDSIEVDDVGEDFDDAEEENRLMEDFPEDLATLEVLNESTWASFLQNIPENEGAGPEALVHELNGKFNSGHSGVFQRLVYARNPQPWYTTRPTMSWSVMNHYSWNHFSNEITVFNYHGPASGIIAKPSSMRVGGMVKCFYPCDGYSDHRYYDNRGCACGKTYSGQKGLGTMACPASKTDWCDQYGRHFPFRGNGIPCAYRPSEESRMLHEYHEVKTGRASKNMQASCTASWLKVDASGSNAWNEAVIDTRVWERTGGAKHIAAFVLPSNCLDSWGCRSSFWMWYERFKMAGKGKRPVVVMDLHKKYSPYRLL